MRKLIIILVSLIISAGTLFAQADGSVLSKSDSEKPKKNKKIVKELPRKPKSIHKKSKSEIKQKAKNKKKKKTAASSNAV